MSKDMALAWENIVKQGALDKAQKERDKLKKRGLREYYYGEHIIMASDKTKADRKARKKGLIT